MLSLVSYPKEKLMLFRQWLSKSIKMNRRRDFVYAPRGNQKLKNMLSSQNATKLVSIETLLTKSVPKYRTWSRQGGDAA
jgi:hypothetical protein